jgi:hypothetical protein
MTQAPTLGTSDRCDRCGAQAYARVELAGGSDLLFCAHHARIHEPKLREIAVRMRDAHGQEIASGALMFNN